MKLTVELKQALKTLNLTEAAQVVDWFYVTSSLQVAPPTGEGRGIRRPRFQTVPPSISTRIPRLSRLGNYNSAAQRG